MLLPDTYEGQYCEHCRNQLNAKQIVEALWQQASYLEWGTLNAEIKNKCIPGKVFAAEMCKHGYVKVSLWFDKDQQEDLAEDTHAVEEYFAHYEQIK